MDMAFAQARIGDLDELRALLQVRDCGRTGVAHGRLHTANQLMNHVACRAFVCDLTFDPFRHELQLVLDVLLEIAIR